MNKVELLAPAGSFEALKAAIAAGADAVYLGGSGYGARAFAKNFDNEEIVEAIKFAHLYNVKIYVTLNTIIYDHELDDVFNYVKFLYNNDVDAIIVQDLGLMNVIKNSFPDLELHASTQMTLHNLEGVKFLKSIGINRVVVARENSIEQIKRIVNETGMDVEAFVHGAICVCFSGQCYMSGLIGGRSGNRGKCAQPCRKQYSLKVNDQTTKDSKFYISPRDLNTIENIDQIIESGIKSLKIEGRMKSPEYVAIVVDAYRRAIDYYYENKKGYVSKEDLSNITQIFNRKFTKGFLFNEKGHDFINLDKNNNTGVLIGKIINSEHKKIKIKLSKNLSLNDGIYFNQMEFGMTVTKIIVNNKETKMAKANEVVTLDVPNPLPINTEVYKTTDVLLEEQARTKASLLQIIPVDVEVDLFIHKSPKITIHDELGNCVSEEIDFLVEPGKTQIIDNQKISEQISKLGNTPFILNQLSINRDENIFITLGALNNLRRLAFDKLIRLRENKYNRNLVSLNYNYLDTYQAKGENAPFLSVYVRTMDQLKAALDLNINRIYVDEELKVDERIENLFLAKGRIEYNIKLNQRYRGTLVSNLGALNYAISNQYNKELITNFNLNITNSESIKFLLDNQVDLVTLSYEMNEQGYKNLRFNDKSLVEIIVYGYQEAMITKHCIYASNCKEQCKIGHHGIIDDKNELFNFYTDQLCQMHILNSKKLLLMEEILKLMEFGYSHFRLQFTTENYQDTLNTIDAYNHFIYNRNDLRLKQLQDELKENNNYTRGFYNKLI